VYWDQLEIFDLSGASPGEVAIYRETLKILSFETLSSTCLDMALLCYQKILPERQSS